MADQWKPDPRLEWLTGEMLKQQHDAIRFGVGYGRMTEEGFQHVPYPHDSEVIEGEFKVVEP